MAETVEPEKLTCWRCGRFVGLISLDVVTSEKTYPILDECMERDCKACPMMEFLEPHRPAPGRTYRINRPARS